MMATMALKREAAAPGLALPEAERGAKQEDDEEEEDLPHSKHSPAMITAPVILAPRHHPEQVVCALACHAHG